MIYEKQTSVAGNWVKASEVKDGAKVKIMNETVPVSSVFEGKPRTQNVAKLKIEGMMEEKNANLNKATINALIEAYGKESKEWIGKVLKAQTEKTQIAGKRVTVLYLIPEGFELTEDSGGYVVISKTGEPIVQVDDNYPTDDINPDDIPFQHPV